MINDILAVFTAVMTTPLVALIIVLVVGAFVVEEALNKVVSQYPSDDGEDD